MQDKALTRTVAGFLILALLTIEGAPQAKAMGGATALKFKQDLNVNTKVTPVWKPRIFAVANRSTTTEDSGDASVARARLLEELSRTRKNAKSNSFTPPLPKRRDVAVVKPINEASEGAAQDVDPRADRLISPLLLFKFSGTQPSDPGVRSVRGLLQSGAIAGVVVGHENMQTKPQLKELIKFFETANAKARPVIAVSETGGEQPPPPLEVGLSIPSQSAVARGGDAQYAFTTYATLSSNLANYGFNMNFGPYLSGAALQNAAGVGFGLDPLQAAVYARTFISAHKEAGLSTALLIRADETGSPALKLVLSSFPNNPVALLPRSDGVPLSINLTGDIRGPLYCFVNGKRGQEGEAAVGLLRQGCDGLILLDTSEKPEVLRLRIAHAAAEALSKQVLDADLLSASARRLELARVAASQGSE